MDEDGHVTVGDGNGDLDRVMAVVRRLYRLSSVRECVSVCSCCTKSKRPQNERKNERKGKMNQNEGKMRRNGAFSIILKTVRLIRGASRG